MPSVHNQLFAIVLAKLLANDCLAEVSLPSSFIEVCIGTLLQSWCAQSCLYSAAYRVFRLPSAAKAFVNFYAATRSRA